MASKSDAFAPFRANCSTNCTKLLVHDGYHHLPIGNERAAATSKAPNSVFFQKVTVFLYSILKLQFYKKIWNANEYQYTHAGRWHSGDGLAFDCAPSWESRGGLLHLFEWHQTEVNLRSLLNEVLNAISFIEWSNSDKIVLLDSELSSFIERHIIIIFSHILELKETLLLQIIS